MTFLDKSVFEECPECTPKLLCKKHQKEERNVLVVISSIAVVLSIFAIFGIIVQVLEGNLFFLFKIIFIILSVSFWFIWLFYKDSWNIPIQITFVTITMLFSLFTFLMLPLGMES